jgi:hypothetical protein
VMYNDMDRLHDGRHTTMAPHTHVVTISFHVVCTYLIALSRSIRLHVLVPLLGDHVSSVLWASVAIGQGCPASPHTMVSSMGLHRPLRQHDFGTGLTTHVCLADAAAMAAPVLLLPTGRPVLRGHPCAAECVSGPAHHLVGVVVQRRTWLRGTLVTLAGCQSVSRIPRGTVAFHIWGRRGCGAIICVPPGALGWSQWQQYGRRGG